MARPRERFRGARDILTANWLREQGIWAEERVFVMLGDQVELWETALAAMKLRHRHPHDTANPSRGSARARTTVIVWAGDTAKFHDVPRRGAS